MRIATDLSEQLARRLLATEGAAAARAVARIERIARADGDMARARLASDVATRLASFTRKGVIVDVLA